MVQWFFSFALRVADHAFGFGCFLKHCINPFTPPNSPGKELPIGCGDDSWDY